MGTKIYFSQYGTPEVLKVGEEALAAPEAGEVQVSNRAISVNPADWMVIAGYFKHVLPLSTHSVPGVESAGIVIALGPDVTEFAVGDPVIRHGSSNSYRQEANYRVEELRAKPQAIAFEQAAALTVAGGTAYSAIRMLTITARDTLLVHAAAGGVGSATVQIAKSLGARVIGTASLANHDYLRSIGAEPVEYGKNLVTVLQSLGPITASFDAAGRSESVAATRAVLPDSQRALTALGNQHAIAAGIRGVSQVADRVDVVIKLAEEGKLIFEIGRRYPLHAARNALELSAAGHVRGKIILIP